MKTVILCTTTCNQAVSEPTPLRTLPIVICLQMFLATWMASSNNSKPISSSKTRINSLLVTTIRSITNMMTILEASQTWCRSLVIRSRVFLLGMLSNISQVTPILALQDTKTTTRWTSINLFPRIKIFRSQRSLDESLPNLAQITLCKVPNNSISTHPKIMTQTITWRTWDLSVDDSCHRAQPKRAPKTSCSKTMVIHLKKQSNDSSRSSQTLKR